MKKVLAFDFGASSGRAIIGSFDNGKISLQEVHRFSNDPVKVNGTLYWDVLRLLHEIKQGIVKAKMAGGFDSIGIDTWGVDFGLIDKDGRLLENPVHYRDPRTAGLVEEAFKTIPKEKLYKITGIQFMELNTLFQLISLRRQRPELLERADKMLFMPDLLAYFLTGKMCAEYSIASTSQLIDIENCTWSKELLEAFDIPESLFAPLVQPGTVLGELTDEICEELGVDKVPVISVCGHDTQSAITAVPCPEGDFAFLSSGTWSLFGTELKTPIVDETSLKINITNEGGIDGTIGLLKNIIGLWLIQESRRQWQREGQDYSYAELEKLALKEEPFKCFIDPDAPEFTPQGNIPRRVQEFCKKTGQYVPQSVGEIMRCIYESLAMKYRLTFEKLCDCTNKDYPVIHVIGGGTKDGLLCQMTANSCDRTVKAGPIEATVMGNVAVQFMSDGTIKDVAHARQAVADSETLKVYNPENADEWKQAYPRFVEIAKY
ncbi:MAG: rhamnulokinase [Clostridia bacterium]|nr:rhamnulokinase [Clostridia bacterium]